MSNSNTDVYAPPSASLEPTGQVVDGVTEGLLRQLAGTRPWTRLIAIVLIALALVTLLSMTVTIVTMGASGAGVPGLEGSDLLGVSLVFNVVFALLYLAFGVVLMRYTMAITRSIRQRTASAAREAIVRQRQFWQLFAVAGVVGCVAGLVMLVLFRDDYTAMYKALGGMQ